MFERAFDKIIKNATTAELPDIDFSDIDLSGLSEYQVNLINNFAVIYPIYKPIVKKGIRLRMLNEELDKAIYETKELIKGIGGLIWKKYCTPQILTVKVKLLI